MDVFEYVFKGLVSILGLGILGWCGYIMNCVNKNRDNIGAAINLIKAHELEDARIYVQKTDFKETVVELKDTVKRMYDKIDTILSVINKNG